jgi:hypothetical protein
MPEGINILYIVGNPHGGSTLLNLLLGANSHITSLGEFKTYNRTFSETRHKVCSCGELLDACYFWKSIQERATSDGSDWPFASAGGKSVDNDDIRLLGHILEIAKTTWVCDSSRDVDRLLAYAAHPQCNVFPILLVRDPRAVAYSFKKKYKKWTTFRKQLIYANRRFWKQKQVCQSFRKYYCIRYEDLVADPETEISSLMKEINISFERNQIDYAQIEQHIFSGNRVKTRRDGCISHDIGYTLELNRLRWLLSTIASFPLLVFMKYPLRKKSYFDDVPETYIWMAFCKHLSVRIIFVYISVIKPIPSMWNDTKSHISKYSRYTCGTKNSIDPDFINVKVMDLASPCWWPAFRRCKS